MQAILLLSLGILFCFVNKNVFSSTLFYVEKSSQTKGKDSKLEEKNIVKGLNNISNQEEDKVEVKKINPIVEDEIKVEIEEKSIHCFN